MDNRDQLLDRLTRRMDRELSRIKRLNSYTTDKAPLPEMGPNLKSSWEKFQHKSITNFGGLIVDALAERIVVNGVTVGDNADSGLAELANRIWRDNRLTSVIADAVRDSLITGKGYLLISEDDGRAVITRESPDSMFVMSDPAKPWRAKYAVKVWRDSATQLDYAVLFADGKQTTYVRESSSDGRVIWVMNGGWKPVTGSTKNLKSQIPIVVLQNLGDEGEFENHTDLIDRINWGILQRLVTTAMQAFKQRALKSAGSDSFGLPETDDDGNMIDYQRIFEPGPGALWELPPGVELWESNQTDLRPMLEASKEDMRALSAVTRTPITVLMPDNTNSSAEGAAASREGLVFKAKDRIARLSPALDVMMVLAMKSIEGVDLGGNTLKVRFEPPSMVSLTEKFAAAMQAKAAGLALETVQRDILGMSPDQIAEDRRRRTEEIFELAAFGAPAVEPAT